MLAFRGGLSVVFSVIDLLLIMTLCQLLKYC